uniref:Uncharacterized protein n=1 Tax=Vespula pensylvanica TaxID=30213 RepID=A0A834MW75_VESPE|nr:hypothetical protein H0235_018277 [Vespula pensylvanica]
MLHIKSYRGGHGAYAPAANIFLSSDDSVSAGDPTMVWTVDREKCSREEEDNERDSCFTSTRPSESIARGEYSTEGQVDLCRARACELSNTSGGERGNPLSTFTFVPEEEEAEEEEKEGGEGFGDADGGGRRCTTVGGKREGGLEGGEPERWEATVDDAAAAEYDDDDDDDDEERKGPRTLFHGCPPKIRSCTRRRYADRFFSSSMKNLLSKEFPDQGEYIGTARDLSFLALKNSDRSTRNEEA